MIHQGSLRLHEAISWSNIQMVMRAPPARPIFNKHAFLNQIKDVSECAVLRAFGQKGPFRAGKVSLKSIQQPIHDESLPYI